MSKLRSEHVQLDCPHHVDIAIAQWLKANRGVAIAAKYLKQFGWSLDSARCILLRNRAITQKH